MRVFGHAMPTGKLGAEGGVIPISATMHSLKLCAVANCGLVWMVDFARCTGDRVKLSWT